MQLLIEVSILAASVVFAFWGGFLTGRRRHLTRLRIAITHGSLWRRFVAQIAGREHWLDCTDNGLRADLMSAIVRQPDEVLRRVLERQGVLRPNATPAERQAALAQARGGLSLFGPEYMNP